MNRRITDIEDIIVNDDDASPDYLAYTDTTELYYSNWQLIEEKASRNGQQGQLAEDGESVELESISYSETRQNVWSQSYVDDLVLRDRDADHDSGTGGFGTVASGLEERLYAQQDANHNVTSITNVSGTVQERFAYDPYGAFTALTSAGSATSDTYAWTSLHQGTRWVTELGLYDVRNRFYSPTLMRWMQEDPAGYRDSLLPYEVTRSAPTRYVDPEGRQATNPYDAIDDEGQIADEAAKRHHNLGPNGQPADAGVIVSRNGTRKTICGRRPRKGKLVPVEPPLATSIIELGLRVHEQDHVNDPPTEESRKTHRLLTTRDNAAAEIPANIKQKNALLKIKYALKFLGEVFPAATCGADLPKVDTYIDIEIDAVDEKIDGYRGGR